MSGRISQRRKRPNSPPPSETWLWITQDMLESPAWRAMPSSARTILDRIILEHMHHAGRLNGSLPVTRQQFVEYGARRNSVGPAIELLIRLGWIVRTSKGHRSAGSDRAPSTYAVTWLPFADEAVPLNTWKRVTADNSDAAVEDWRAAQGRGTGRNAAAKVSARCALPQEDIDSSPGNAPRGIEAKLLREVS